MKVSESITKCDFCGISKEKADRLHDVFHLTGWPCLLCTTCMNKEFGSTDEEYLLAVAHEIMLKRMRDGGEEE